MSLTWILALAAVLLWAFAYAWYFVGHGRVDAMFSRFWAAVRQRLPLGKKSG